MEFACAEGDELIEVGEPPRATWLQLIHDMGEDAHLSYIFVTRADKEE